MNKLISWIVGGALVIGVLGLIGLWYLALFGIALIVFIALFVTSRVQRKNSQDALVFRPSKLVPAEAWERTNGAHYTDGPRTAIVSLVSLDTYADNWTQFAEIAQIERETQLPLTGKLLCFKTPTADRGIIVAYRRMILGEVRDIEVDRFFNQLWELGGVFKVDCVISFDSSLQVEEMECAISYVDGQRDAGYPSREKQAWDVLWGGLRGKRIGEEPL